MDSSFVTLNGTAITGNNTLHDHLSKKSFNIMGSNGRKLVFVYGSLKSGFGNNALLRQTDSKYVGAAETVDRNYRMISFGAFPGVYKDGESIIDGEVYAANSLGMQRLDMLESNGSFYNREVVDVLLDNGTKAKAWMYILIPCEAFDRRERLEGIECWGDDEDRQHENWIGMRLRYSHGF